MVFRNPLDTFEMIVEQALANLRTQPKNIGRAMDFVAESNDIAITDPIYRLVNHLATCGPNDRIRHILIKRLQQWDHEDVPSWSKKSVPHSKERRHDALGLLGFQSADFLVIDEAIPRFTESEIPIVIAEKHTPWYEGQKNLIRSFYWDHYQNQLSKPKGSWDSEAVSALNISTDDVIARISDPTRAGIYQVKGLVMGYVQSGKTSHFSGLIAKSADAGYRLIIVLAGTMDILRQQTQRRIDKEIVGRELLEPDEYGMDSDWKSFVEHNGVPSEIGTFDFERLTNRHEDYTALRQHLNALQFKKLDATKPFNHPDNLRNAPVKLAVIKKTPNRISKLCSDLRRLKALRSVLEHVPTLIIDDESDQASVNTIDRSKKGKENRRTGTNSAIAELLKLLPRAQYVGYTATPFANVFIDPEDADDLFPKDFIVSLPRPAGYMGVSDFYDFENDFELNDFRNNRRAFVRSVVGKNDEKDNLPKAVDSFVLSGAIKLFRHSRRPSDYFFRHHTMLVHHSAKKVVHEGEAEEVRVIFGGGSRYQKKDGMNRLQALFDEDFAPVSAIRAANDVFPRTFGELKPFISDCVTRICDEKAVLIVNGDNKDDTPDFDQRSVWAILVGGAKLSRGYTVEGLTTSYYRRPAGAGDTLMQMGRWFGFRPGYRDLVRLFIGKNERRGKMNIDLYEAFGAVCRDEEALRTELLKYRKGELTPKQVAPLVRQHLPFLPPTSKNKMFNAQIMSMDFGGAWTEKTAAPYRDAEMKLNLKTMSRLLAACENLGKQLCLLTNKSGIVRNFEAYAGVAKGRAILDFLENYRWAESALAVKLETEYLRARQASGVLAEWVVLLPQIDAQKIPLSESGFPPLSVVGRSRVSVTRFGVFSEPRHRDVAEFASAVSEGSNASEFLNTLRKRARPVLVIYLVEDKGNTRAETSVGFGMQFPGAKLTNAIVWSVADPKRSEDVVVPAAKITGI